MCMGDNDSINLPQTISRKPLHRRGLKVFAYIDDYGPISNTRSSQLECQVERSADIRCLAILARYTKSR